MAEPTADLTMVEVLIHVPVPELATLRKPPPDLDLFFAHCPRRPPLEVGALFFLESRGAKIAQATVYRMERCPDCVAGWMVYWRPESVCWLN